MTNFRMQDLSEIPNPNYKPPVPKPTEAPKPKKKVVRRKTSGASRTARPQTAKMPTKESKPIPPSAAQPRDHLGRFASHAGAVLWGIAKGAGKAVVGTAKVANNAHKAAKRVNAAKRRSKNIEMRERAIAIREREQALSGRRKVVRRKKR
jgi:hypothetical protein